MFYRNFLLLLFIPSILQTKPFVEGRLMGGVGNQMFQIAATYAHAWENGAEPCFTEAYVGATFPDSAIHRHVLSRINKTAKNSPVQFLWIEPNLAYHKIPYSPNMSLYGYFQSEKHFHPWKDRIIELFAPLDEDVRYIQEKYGPILMSSSTVGIQLRYYMKECKNLPWYCQYGRDYLEKAMSLFPEDSIFLVSSNNIDFAKAAIPSWAENVVFLENEEDFIEFYLLSFCKHNIITNSSFGWWSAYLNENPNKIIVRPENWLDGHPCQDICPKEWISLKADWEAP